MPSILFPLRSTALACLLTAPWVTWAQPAVAAPAAAASAAKATERAHVNVIEDEGVRIEEHRVRGVVTKIVVQSKVGAAPPYEIQVAPPGRESMSDRGSTGKRTWSLLRF
jgi:hypothetical protein